MWSSAMEPTCILTKLMQRTEVSRITQHHFEDRVLVMKLTWPTLAATLMWMALRDHVACSETEAFDMQEQEDGIGHSW